MSSSRTRHWRRPALVIALVATCGAGPEARCDPTLSCSWERAESPPSIFDAARDVVCMEEMDCEVRRVALGDRHTCVGTRDEVYCWGDAAGGQLGETPSMPGEIVLANRVEPGGFAEVHTGDAATCAVTEREDVREDIRCWGDRLIAAPPGGVLGDATGNRVVLSFDPAALALGSSHACNVQSGADGGPSAVQCWGADDHGQVSGALAGPGGVVRLDGIGSVSAIAAGTRFTCAVRPDQNVICWGAHPGDPGADPAPREVPGTADVLRLAAGAAHVCALHTSGAVSCWGENAFGQLGDGTRESRSEPVTIAGIADARRLAAGGRFGAEGPAWGHTCVVRGGTRSCDRSVWCWGRGAEGQLGDGGTQDRLTPVQVMDAAGPLANPARLDLGGAHSCVEVADGQLRCWGDNTFGQLGPGAPRDANSPTPQVVPGFFTDDDFDGCDEDPDSDGRGPGGHSPPL